MMVMLLACGTPAILLPIGLLALAVMASVPLGLAAMTSVVFRPGHDVSAVRRVSHVNLATGLCLLPLGFFAPPVALLGLGLLAIGVTTRRLNAAR